MYTTIIHPIRLAFNLSINEYCVLDSIHMLCNNQKYGGWCIASKERIGKELSLSRQSVQTILKTLESKGLIERNETGAVRSLDEWNEVIANKEDHYMGFDGKVSKILSGPQKDKKTVCKESLQCVKKVDRGVKKVDTDCKESLHNNNNYNNNDNISTKVDREPAVSTRYGKENINKILIALRESVGIEAFADSRIERNIGKHVVSLLEKIGKEEFRRRLEYVLGDDFRRKNCNRIKYLYGELKSVPTKNIKPKVLIIKT